ncbi:glycoside hydrolase family protein [Spiribacter onubensis]|uniref:Lysozyme n=1 Tax=Spiribacter onubensis TaxID=3122420 RepID=A0ABV3S9X0_9GAMM
MNTQRIRERLKAHEGCVLHAYEDSEGFLTIGYGRLIDERRGGGISQSEADQMLTHDIIDVTAQLSARKPVFRSLPEPVQESLVEMAFQMGVAGLMKFHDMWASLEVEDYAGAHDAALDSDWADETPQRAREVADRLDP